NWRGAGRHACCVESRLDISCRFSKNVASTGDAAGLMARATPETPTLVLRRFLGVIDEHGVERREARLYGRDFLAGYAERVHARVSPKVSGAARQRRCDASGRRGALLS